MLFNCIIGIWIAAGIILGCSLPPVKGLVAPAAMYFHVPMAMAMEFAFFASAFQGVLWLRKRDAAHDAKSFAFAEVGAWLGVIATTTGAIWAKLNWNSYWSWDPQQIGIVALLLTYAALFALRGAVDDEDKRRDLWAVYAIIGALSAIFWTFVFRNLAPLTSHPSGTLKNSDPIYRFALWFNIAGYVMLMTKLAMTRAKLELFSLQLRAREEEAEYSASRAAMKPISN